MTTNQTSKISLDDLKAGDVLLCPPVEVDGKIGQIISQLTNSEVCHSALYYGIKDGVKTVAHSDQSGIIYLTLDCFMETEPMFYVRRHNKQNDLNPVLKASQVYASPYENRNEDGGNCTAIPYPKADLAFLGLLALENRFLPNTLLCRKFYNFLLLTSIPLMKKINKTFYQEHSMTCSQFVSQCFTDAGDAYDFKFDKLILEFKKMEGQNEKMTLLEMLDPDRKLEIKQSADESVLQKQDKIYSDFYQLIKEDKLVNEDDAVSKEKILEAAAHLLLVICMFMFGKQPLTVKDALNLISTNRNFIVAPQDLLVNATNLDLIGQIGEKSNKEK